MSIVKNRRTSPRRTRYRFEQRWGTVCCICNILAIYCNICNIYCILLPEANIAIYTACLRRILRHCHIFYSEATIYCYMEFSTISGKQIFFFFYNFFGFGSISNFSHPSIFIAICTTGLTLMFRTRKKKLLRASI